MANTKGEKELKTSWDELTALDQTKAIGHVKNLIPEEGTAIPARYRVGLD
jgi:hypothetical protein